MSVTSADVLVALAARKNVLLEGPPGTGKTLLLSELVAALTNPAPGGGPPVLRVNSSKKPIANAAGPGSSAGLPVPVDVEWITFHQSYSYEEFILGKRPVPDGGAVRLEPHLGLLLSLAVALDDSSGAPAGKLLIIDEISRGNASQVFGEFITLLDPTYRRTVNDAPNPHAVPIKFPGISYVDGLSEPIKSMRSTKPVTLPEDWRFPEHVYVVATMNSVDKAAMPLDSALTRRFHRIHMNPDLTALALALGVGDSWKAIAEEARQPGADLSGLTAELTTVMLLERLNVSIAADLGEDFELGQGLLWSVVSSEQGLRWRALIEAWEHDLKPQLLERYAGRPDSLKDLLHVSTEPSAASAFAERRVVGSPPLEGAPVLLTDLRDVSESIAQATLRSLTV